MLIDPQNTIFHLLSIRKRWSNHRFLPTALSSFLNLTHFHLTLLSHHYFIPPPELQPKNLKSSSTSSVFASPTPPPPEEKPILYSSHTGTAHYPPLNYVPNIFETFLILTVFLTAFLNALTQLLLTGRVSRPLLGLGLGGPGRYTQFFICISALTPISL